MIWTARTWIPRLTAGCLLVFPATAMASTETLTQQFDRIVQSGLDDKQYPGTVLIVGSPNQLVHAKAYGRYTYAADSKPVTLDTIFDLASVTKVVGTATAAMKLAEEGKLNLNNRVSAYIPEFTTGGKELAMVKDLMIHVSGLKSYDSAATAEKGRKPGQTQAQALIRRIASLPASQPPRTKVTYSCLNMLTMAYINEMAIGGTMQDYLTEKVYAPLGMKDTTYRLTPAQLQRTAPTMLDSRSKPNTGKIHDPLANYYYEGSQCPGNAGLFSTGPDLAWYCTMILNEGSVKGQQVFKQETIRTMTALHTPEGVSNFRGLGWDIQVRPPYCTPLNNSDETRVISHAGYTGTYIWLDKLSKTYFVFLTNRTMKDGPGESKADVGRHRTEIIQALLRSRPEYQEYFATLPADDQTTRPRPRRARD